MAVYLKDGSELSASSSGGLNGYNIFAFGDSNVETSWGINKRDVGFLFNRFATEFPYLGEVGNFGASGTNIWQMSVKFLEWATDANAAAYNNERTILLFHSGTNDTIDLVSVPDAGNDNNPSSNATKGLEKSSAALRRNSRL